MAVHQTLELYFLNNMWSCGILTSNEKKIAQHQTSVALFSLHFDLDIFSAAAENFSKSHLDSKKGISGQLDLSRNVNAGRTDTSKPIVHKHKLCSGCLKSECLCYIYFIFFSLFCSGVVEKRQVPLASANVSWPQTLSRPFCRLQRPCCPRLPLRKTL